MYFRKYKITSPGEYKREMYKLGTSSHAKNGEIKFCGMHQQINIPLRNKNLFGKFYAGKEIGGAV